MKHIVSAGRDRAIAHVARTARLIATVVALLTPALASSQQDTSRHAMPGMPGVPGMKMPAAPSTKPVARPDARLVTRATAAPKPAPKSKSRSVRPRARRGAKPVVPFVRKASGAEGRAPADTAPAHDMSRMPPMDHKPAADTTMRDMKGMPGMQHKTAPDSSTRDMPGMAGMDHNPPRDTVGHQMQAMPGMPAMKMIDAPLGIPMERTGSGTSWLPDDSPMHAAHLMAGQWELMLHGVAFAMYDKQGSRRGDEQFSSVNWGMLMATRELGGGRLQLRGMLSAEPWTVGGRGYPLLLQTGETFQGTSLHDRQHPHDLFMELAGLYEHAVSDRLGVSLYVAPVGEPAIGPVAFPHRPSAMNDPMAPIGHHWQDATHISFGVLTAGVFTHALRLESSVFNGREPDENRTNFDYAGRSLDSYAGRLSWNPTSHWSLAGAYAYLKSPEALKPDESVHRITVSAMNGRTFGRHGELATTFVYGANRHAGSGHLEPSYLVESNLEFGGAHSIFGRAEQVQKGAEDLALGANGPDGEFNITSLVGGYVYEFDRVGSVRTGIGARASVDFIPSSLEPYYGTRAPRGFAIYVRFRPQRASEGHDARMAAPKSDDAHGAHR